MHGVHGVLAQEQHPSVWEAVVESVRQLLPKAQATVPLTTSTSLFEELALDSLQVLQLVVSLQDLVGRELTEADFRGRVVGTIGELAALIDELRGRQNA
jgi:acyl carrier protein